MANDDTIVLGGASFSPYCPKTDDKARPLAPVVVRVPTALPKEAIKDFLKGCSLKADLNFREGRRAHRPVVGISIALVAGDGEILIRASDEVALEGVCYD